MSIHNESVLVLNATYEPIAIVPLKRAMGILLTNRAHVVEEKEGHVLCSEKLSFPYPSVVRLNRYVNIPFKKMMPTRSRVLSRDNHECAYCGKYADTIDHIIPRSKNGPHEWANVIAACMPCNSRKSDYLLGELGWELRYLPTMPPSRFWLVIGHRDRAQWDKYITTSSVAA